MRPARFAFHEARAGIGPDAGRGDLAMVLIDTNYDGELFQLHHWRFADELKSQDWTISLPHSPGAKRSVPPTPSTNVSLSRGARKRIGGVDLKASRDVRASPSGS